MIQRDGDWGGANPEEFVHRATAKLIELGWPKWPPEESPKLREWWREEQSIPPSRLPLFDQSVEVIGTPQAGKSKLFAEAMPALASLAEKSGWDFRFEPESLADADELTVEVIKELRWSDRMYRDKDLSSRLELAIGERGVVDAAIWYHALVADSLDPRFKNPDNDPLYLGILLSRLASVHEAVERLDAVVVMGISHEEAQRRRALDGKTEPGGVTGRPFYDELSAWYGHWIHNVWPKIHALHGTGLLVLNGELPIEENRQRLVEFVGKMVA